MPASDSTSGGGPDRLVEITNLSKHFGSVTALDRVSLDIRKGEIHCLLGENGAGKSTLAECLFGSYQPDSGEIRFKGDKVDFASPADAIDLGIGMVHQHFVLVRPFTVVENVVLVSRASGVILDLDSVADQLKAVCVEYGVSLDLDAEIWQLSIGEQQWVEILKAIHAGIDLLIMDEPTAVLTPQETDRLFGVLKKMAAEGLSIVLITHKLEEVTQISDRVTVLRNGKVVGTVETTDVSQGDLATMMVGRELTSQAERRESQRGDLLLSISDLEVLDDRNRLALHGVSMDLHEGEILGIAGVAGNGQRELFEALIGVRKVESGRISVGDVDITGKSPRLIKGLGVAQIPDDRIGEGLIAEFAVSENLILGQQRSAAYRKGPFLDRRRIERVAEEMVDSFGIATPSVGHKTKFLSGGNLQKVILARELQQDPRIVLANQPCRGLDIGVIEYVRGELLRRRAKGIGVVLISEDLDEIFSLSDRIAVIHKGQVMGVIRTAEARREEIGLLMAGVVGGRQ